MFSTLQYNLQLIKCKLHICIIQVICVTSFLHSSSISTCVRSYMEKQKHLTGHINYYAETCPQREIGHLTPLPYKGNCTSF